MSFIDTNTILDNEDDYEVEDFESPFAAFYFVEKPDPNR